MAEKKRHWFLTLWLILMIIANALTAVSYISGGALITTFLAINSWAIYTFGVLAILNVVFAVYLLQWKKWAFYAFAASAVIAFIVNLVIGTGVPSFGGLIGVGILYLAMRLNWKQFK